MLGMFSNPLCKSLSLVVSSQNLFETGKTSFSAVKIALLF